MTANNYAYPIEYLEQNIKSTEYLFSIYLNSPYDYDACVNAYMSTSKIREGMDKGNWSALNKGIKQIYNSVDMSNIPEKRNDELIDSGVSDWMAEIYVCLQWKYNISSKLIIQRLPSEKLRAFFCPLHEASIENGVDKVYEKFFRDQ